MALRLLTPGTGSTNSIKQACTWVGGLAGGAVMGLRRPATLAPATEPRA